MSLLLSLCHQCKTTVNKKESLVTYLFYFICGATDTLFWTSSDFSSGFQSQSGQPYSHLMEEAARSFFFPELSVIMLGGTHVTITYDALPSVQGSPQPPETDPPHRHRPTSPPGQRPPTPRTETPGQTPPLERALDKNPSAQDNRPGTLPRPPPLLYLYIDEHTVVCLVQLFVPFRFNRKFKWYFRFARRKSPRFRHFKRIVQQLYWLQTHSKRFQIYYRLRREGNVFTNVCQSFCPGGVRGRGHAWWVSVWWGACMAGT